jgi:hypothetical protein
MIEVGTAERDAPITFIPDFLDPESSLVRASERQQPFAPGMLCTGTKRDSFSWGLDLAARRCTRKSCGRAPDVRKRIIPCTP